MSTLLTILDVAATTAVLALSGPGIWKTFRCSLCARSTAYNRLSYTCYQDEDGEADDDFAQQAGTSVTTRRLVIFSAAAHTTLTILRPWIIFFTHSVFIYPRWTGRHQWTRLVDPGSVTEH